MKPLRITEQPPPNHPFEVRISIGGNDLAFVARTLDELAEMVRSEGDIASRISGGYDGSFSYHLQSRDITAEQFRDELEEWLSAQRESR